VKGVGFTNVTVLLRGVPVDLEDLVGRVDHDRDFWRGRERERADLDREGEGGRGELVGDAELVGQEGVPEGCVAWFGV